MSSMWSNKTDNTSELLDKVELVGRQEQINQFHSLLSGTGFSFLFYDGEGGIGKTWLLLHLLKIAKEVPGQLVLPEIIDLYHIQSHDREGLLRLLLSKLPEADLQDCRRILQAVDRERGAGDVARASNYLEDTLRAFERELISISEQRKVILALDTAERWVYGERPELRRAEAWDWLLKLAGQMRNGLFLLAGRSPIRHLVEGARQAGVVTLHTTLHPLKDEETKRYIEAVSREYSKFEFQEREIQALSTLSQGRPILLALFLEDYLLAPSRRKLTDLVEQAEAFNRAAPDEKQTWQKNYEKNFTTRLMEWPIMSDIWGALGRAPKGVDATLLAEMLEIDTRQAQNLLEQASKYVLAKRYAPGREDFRLFLHDRVHDMLREHIFDTPTDYNTRQNTYEKIKGYYDKRIHRTTNSLTRIFDQASLSGQRVGINTNELAYLESYRYRQYSEIVYYSLRNNLPGGLKRYARYVHEAVVTGAPQALIPLEIELSSFLIGIDVLKDQQPEPNCRVFLEGLLRLLPVQRHFAEGHHAEGIALATTAQPVLERELSAFPVENGIILAALYIWQGYNQIFHRQNRELAESILEKGIKILEGLKNVDVEPQKWYKNYTAGLGYRALGYLRRTYGQFQGAREGYQKSLSYWRETDLKVEQAFARNDLGFALAEAGEFDDASSNVDAALDIRKELGLGRNIGMSLNTQAHIALRQGDYARARSLAEQALALFEALQDRHYKGYAMIALAEALRRLAGDDEQTPQRRDKINLLTQARNLAKQAADLYSSKEVDLADREVEALIEQGCAARDWVKISSKESEPWENIPELIQESESTLRRAAEVAGEHDILYRELDALVNLAWLMYNVDHETPGGLDKVHKAISGADKAFPKNYLILPHQEPTISKELATNLIWLQLGKLHSLIGHIAMDRWEKSYQENDLRDCIEHYYLALRYNAQFGESDRGMRSAKRYIFDRLDPLEFKRQKQVAVMLLKVEEDYGTPNSKLQGFLKNQGLWPM